tara:strand:+ start:6370 stop:7257 length:888 start_codon:yes stop_codon:yes gene_type:complete
MKRGILVLVFAVFLMSVSMVAAVRECNLDASLINQDPYPAVPGEYVKVVFELTGISSLDCGLINFEVEDDYPFLFDSGVERITTFNPVTYTSGFRNTAVLPYRIRIDEEALDGENEIRVIHYGSAADFNTFVEETFNITVEDSRTDFEVHVKDYSFDEKKLIFEILNIGEKDIEALTIEIPEQDSVEIIGSDRVIIGDVDSNEDDTASFYAEVRGDEIKIDVYYTDQIGVRRKVEKTVMINRDNFKRSVDESSGLSSATSFLLGIVLIVALYFGYKWWKKRKERKKHRHHPGHHR